MKKITTILTLIAVGLAWSATDCSAQRPDRQQGKNGVQKRGPGIDGQQRGVARDPAKRVQKIIEQFDADDDQKLDATELQEFLASVNQRRGQQGGRPRGGGGLGEGGPQSPDLEGSKRGKRGGRKGKGKGKSRPGGGADFQGKTPSLPPAE